MKSLKNKLAFILIFQFVGILYSYCQVLNATFEIESQSATSATINVFLSKSNPQRMKLSGVTTYLAQPSPIAFAGAMTPTWTEGSAFMSLNDPMPNLNSVRIRAVQAPIGDSTSAILITSDPQLYGTITVTSTAPIPYPITLTPTNAFQALVYHNNSPTSTALIINATPLVLVPLPISISYLNAKESGITNVINWTTASEVNNEFQIIESSLNGSTNWKEIGRVNAKNNPYGASYEFFDSKPSKLNYYRIHSIDFDGKEQFSKIVYVQREGRSGIITAIHPNPTANFVEIDLQPEYDDEVTYSILDATGKLLKSINYIATQVGLNTHTLDMSDLQNGLYILSIQGGGINQNTKIFKQ